MAIEAESKQVVVSSFRRISSLKKSYQNRMNIRRGEREPQTDAYCHTEVMKTNGLMPYTLLCICAWSRARGQETEIDPCKKPKEDEEDLA